jgi:hypothetical protein
MRPDLRISDCRFNAQVGSTEEALKIFLLVSAFEAPGPSRAVLVELVDNTVSFYFSRPSGCFLIRNSFRSHFSTIFRFMSQLLLFERFPERSSLPSPSLKENTLR